MLNRGVRQGCPLSPYLFILSVEVLANAIRQKKEIRGITVKDKEIKLSQYADDTTLILDGSEESLLQSLKIIEHFGNISELLGQPFLFLSRYFCSGDINPRD